MVAKRWALLCGGNFYFDGKARNHGNKILRFPDLEGCVQDVHAMQDFLVCIGVSEIAILTATRGEGRPIEDEERWPTRQNIVRELNRITNAAAPGDLVYIHYSGHGIRRNAAPPDSEGDGMLGSALVMTDVLRGGPYLTAYHLGGFVKRMVEKGLRATLVLDCCFSGRGIRNPELTPRTIPDQYDDSSLESDKAADIDTDLMINSLAQRDTGPVRKSWLSNPTGCAILAACGPHEVAGEGRFGDSTNKHGAFTYGVLSTLRGRSGSALPSHARVLDHVKTKFRELMVGQSPTVLGDGWYEFLGTASYVPRPACHVTVLSGNEVSLDIGKLQGVAVGALYDVFPSDSGFIQQDGVPQLQARVTQVSPFQATAVLMSGSLNTDDGREWCAVLRQWALPAQKFVEFFTSDTDLQAEVKNKVERCPGLTLGNTGKIDFAVRIDGEQTYEILQNGARLPRLPRISIHDKSGTDKLAYVLSHVARFQALRQLHDMPRTGHIQTKNLILNISSPLEAAQGADDSISVEEGKEVGVSQGYGGPGAVHLSLYCFTASWGIRKLDPSHKEGRVSNLTGPGITPLSDLAMPMEIPPKSRPDDPSAITDIFTMFASSADHVSWDEICLSSLPVNGSLDKYLVDATKDKSAYRDPGEVRQRNIDPRWAILERTVHTFPRGLPPA